MDILMKRLFALLVAALLAAAPAHATVNSQTNKTVVLGDGHTTSFAFGFIGVAAADISVTFTDASGNQTVLTQGAGATQYQITLNPPVPGAIWGVGGTVVYNPSGTPIASGTTLTIVRTLALTQAQVLRNQPSVGVLGTGAETASDTLEMQLQQVSETTSRAIAANPSNTTPPAPLPPAAQIANQGLCADSTGNNIVGCALPSTGVISSAMQPVVNAVSLAAGRTAFGLGSMAQENINGGTCGGASIQDDGSAGGPNGVGYARVVYTTVADAVGQSVTCAFHNTERIATGPITYTLPKASTTLFNGWGFRIDAFTGTITVTPNASDNFTGVASGGSVAIPPGASCWISTNAAGSALWLLDCSTPTPAFTANASANALTLTFSMPQVVFRSPTAANGLPQPAIPSGALSVTIPSGATLGTQNSVPFRVWVFLAYNSGTPVLGVATCSTPTSIFPCAAWETIPQTGTAISNGSGTAGTLYTASGVTGDAIRILGYADYANGLVTAGTWASGPTSLQSCLPPFVCKRPGDTVQGPTMFSTTTTSSVSASSYASALAGTITPTSKVNLVQISAFAVIVPTPGLNSGSMTLFRGTTGGTKLVVDQVVQANGSGVDFSQQLSYVDAPATTSSQTYTLGNKGDGTHGLAICTNSESGLAACTLILQEIMGALDAVANDDGTWSSRAAA
jgi:hypothetical protein